MRIRKSAPDRKAEILQAALDIAFELGPDQVTTGMIADRLGLTQPALYKHFTSKEDIWQAVAQTLCERITDNIANAGNPAPAPQIRMRQLVLDHLRLVQDYPALPEIMVMRGRSEALSGALSQIKAKMSEFREFLVITIEDAQAQRHFRPDIDTNDAATLIFGIVQSLVLRLLLSRDPGILLKDGERLLDLQLSLFAAKGGNQ